MPRHEGQRGRPPHPDVLTLREWRVTAFLRQGLSNKAIANEMGVGVNTVRTHVASILSKLNLHKRSDLLQWPGHPTVWSARSRDFGNTTMELAIYMTAIRVRSLDQAVPFYDGLLGQTGILVSPGRYYYYLGGVALALREPDLHCLELLPNPDWIYIATNDLELARANADAVDARITEDIEVFPWGARSFYLRDPDGNGLCFTDAGSIRRHDRDG